MSFKNDHNLIAREQTYVLDRKFVTIHSEDRDVKKWPNSNHFEIFLPQTYNNVQSLKLIECNFPSNNYTFSTDYQNTKLSFRVVPSARPNGINTTIYYYLNINAAQVYTITIPDGYYTAPQLAKEIEYRMNKAVSDYLYEPSPGVHPLSYEDAQYTHFKMYYDEVGQNLWFGNKYDSFFLSFNRQEMYELGNCEQPNVWARYAKWGLPYYLGFAKQEYAATSTTSAVRFNYSDTPIWMSPDQNVPLGSTPTCFYVKSPSTVGVFGETVMYMELDKYNSMDELVPFSQGTSNMYNNDYNGTVNAAFAKIPITSSANTEFFDSKNVHLVNFSHFYPVIDKLRKLKFKFRYHDGRLVDFKNANFTFTIAINCLRDEIARDMKLRNPSGAN